MAVSGYWKSAQAPAARLLTSFHFCRTAWRNTPSPTCLLSFRRARGRSLRIARSFVLRRWISRKIRRRQGFQNQHFDIVIAANVLHATADLRETLRHIRYLLAPGGLIVLIEGTYPERWVDLTFGLTEGWWRFRDRELRRLYPLLSRPAWLDLLTQSGFLDANAIQPLEGSHQSVFFARLPSEASAPGNWLLLPDALGIRGRSQRKSNKPVGRRS